MAKASAKPNPFAAKKAGAKAPAMKGGKSAPMPMKGAHGGKAPMVMSKGGKGMVTKPGKKAC